MTTFGSLFSGIGGLDLGLERAGWECAWQVENDEWCQRVLAQHWPSVPRYGDIREVRELPPVELLCGGFPCQPVSTAGKRLAQDDPRWLWPEFARIVRLLRPRLVLVENVPGLLARGMGDVLGDLAACGYDAEWDCIPAAAFGAPHLRYRVVVVAHAARLPEDRATAQSGSERERAGESGERGRAAVPREDGSQGSVAYAAGGSGGQDGSDLSGSGEWRVTRSAGERGPWGSGGGGGTSGDVAGAEGEPIGAGLREDGSGGLGWRRSGDGRRSGADGILAGGPAAGPALGDRGWWATEPDVGRVAHGVPARVDRLRGLGNAVVPQLGEWIGRRLMEVSA